MSHNEQHNRSRTDRIGNVFAFAVVILLNYLANAVPLGGRTTGDISDAYSSMFTPAGFTFAIWGVIYTALLGFIVRQALNSSAASSALSRIRFPFLLNCLGNALWILTWHYGYVELSMVCMLVILGTLFKINLVLHSDTSLNGWWDSAFIVFPFSIYFGWISVATLANLSVLQFVYGLNDAVMSQQTWTVLKLILAGGAGYLWGWRYSMPTYLFVIAWAAFGISVANSSEPTVELAARILVIVSLLAGALAWRRAPGIIKA